MLTAWRDWQKTEQEAAGVESEGWVFTNTDGKPVHPHSISQTFERIAAKGGVPRIRLHDIRHTHGTLLIKAGVPVKVVSERLGHGSPAFTIDTFQHVLPGMQGEAAIAYEKLINEAQPKQPVEEPVEEPHDTVKALASSPLARAFRSGGGI